MGSKAIERSAILRPHSQYFITYKRSNKLECY